MSFARLVLLVSLAWAPVASACARKTPPANPEQFFEPERGLFLRGSFEPLHLEIRELLLGRGKSTWRPTCGFLVTPAFEYEWSVQIETSSTGDYVIGRRMRRNLSYLMGQELEKMAKSGITNSYDLFDPVDQEKALRRIREQPIEHRAEISSATTARLARICERVLLKTRYVPPAGNFIRCDGTTYHAIHWPFPGEPRTGVVWSPDPDTLAFLFVEMEKALFAFVSARPNTRSAALKKLLDAASRVEKRLGVLDK